MTSSKEIRMAIEKTAGVIENDPAAFAFLIPGVNDARNLGKACPLAWIGHFLDMPSSTTHREVAEQVFHMSPISFYIAVSKGCGGLEAYHDARRVPFLLRKYAEENYT